MRRGSSLFFRAELTRRPGPPVRNGTHLSRVGDFLVRLRLVRVVTEDGSEHYEAHAQAHIDQLDHAARRARSRSDTPAGSRCEAPVDSERGSDIQALRALAVTAVLLYHLWPGLLPGGYVGVDVFFVVSGFLITGQLFHEMRSDRT